MKRMYSILFFMVIPFLVGLACTIGDVNPISPANPDKTPLQPTRTPGLTSQELTVVPTPENPVFFTEEFDPTYKVNNWQYFNLGRGDIQNLSIEQEADHLLFDLKEDDLYIYYMYTPYMYMNVSLVLHAHNLGRNNNNISVVCRMNSEATQWYEFSVASSGLWTLYAMDGIYHRLASGGTRALKKETALNEYQMVCNEDEITVLVNGEQLRTVKEPKYHFTNGLVGFNISSIKDYSVLPITVSIESFEIDLP